MIEPFIPTHYLRIGSGKKRTYWRVHAIPVGEKDGLKYYNAILSPRNRSGLHLVSMVPETWLRPIEKKVVVI